MWTYVSAFAGLKMCGALCSNVVTKAGGGIQGDASEIAIFNFVSIYDDPFLFRNKFPKIAEIPFNSANKFQVSTYQPNVKKKLMVIRAGCNKFTFYFSTDKCTF